jgi:NAD(P)-dependent dehydrogenase (short-subunit alcohol dehydrogenase family)
MRNAYSPSKAGVAMMMKTMAAEWVRHGSTVNVIAPGYIETDMIRDLIESGRLDAISLRRRIPMGALGRPDDIAGAVSFLAAPASSYVTGFLSSGRRWMDVLRAAGDAFPVDEL